MKSRSSCSASLHSTEGYLHDFSVKAMLESTVGTEVAYKSAGTLLVCISRYQGARGPGVERAARFGPLFCGLLARISKNAAAEFMKIEAPSDNTLRRRCVMRVSWPIFCLPKNMRSRLENLMADIFAYAIMTIAVPLVLGPVYLLMNGITSGWKWLFRLMKIWTEICVSSLKAVPRFQRSPLRSQSIQTVTLRQAR